MVRSGAIPCALAMVAALAAAAQTLPGPEGASRQSSETPTVRTTSDLVILDVVVRDKSGAPVTGLTKSDFEVLEDHQKQTILNFDEHMAPAAQSQGSLPALPIGVYTNSPLYGAASRSVILIDALNTASSDLNYARKALLDHLDGVPRGTEIAVFALGEDLRMVQGFTSDLELIRRALGSGPASAPRPLRAAGIPSAPAGSPSNDRLTQADASTRGYLERPRVETTLDAFKELALYLGAVPGRKSLIWLSATFPMPFGDPHAADQTVFQSDLHVVNAMLARARVAVYPVDPRGLMTLPSSGFSSPENNAGLQAAAVTALSDDMATPNRWWQQHSTMLVTADDTGGRAFFNSNAVGEAVAAAIADGSDYYTLTWVPPKSGDGVFHQIEVRTEERAYTLAYRHGYSAASPQPSHHGRDKSPAALAPINAALIHGAPQLTAAIFQVRATAAPAAQAASGHSRPAKKNGESTLLLEYSIDPHFFQLLPGSGGARKAELEIAQAAYALDGRRLANTDIGLEATFSEKQLEEAMRQGMRVHQEISVPADASFLRVAVRDATSGRIGTLEFALANGPGEAPKPH